MRRFLLIIVALVVALVAGGAIFVATWDIPPPTQEVRKVVPNDRFSR